jgi:DNA-binding response OmpR family regulator
LNVTIVAKNPETLDALQTYLRNAGIAARCTGSIEDTCSAISPVVVIFPDDFERVLVLSVLATLRAERPNVLPVVVTSDPRGFERLLPRGEHARILVMPRPAWGFTILDAIRTRIPDDT